LSAGQHHSVHYRWGSLEFENGRSIAAQRGWTMPWLSVGIAAGVSYANEWLDMAAEDRVNDSAVLAQSSWRRAGLRRVGILVFLALASGGFVVVGQMLKAYGD